MEPELQQPTAEIIANNPKKPGNILVPLLTVGLLVCAGVAYYFFQIANSLSSMQALNDDRLISDFVKQDDSVSLADIDSMAENETSHTILPVSSKYQAFVFVTQDSRVKSVPFDQTQQGASFESYGKVQNGGSLGRGDTGLVLAPDFKKFALLQDGKLKIQSVDNEIQDDLSFLNAEYITGWSPDATKLIVYVLPDTILNSIQTRGMQEVPEIIDAPQEFGPSGFVLIDFMAGTYREMRELDGMLVYSWVGNDGLILSSGIGQSEQFYYYSLSAKTVDRVAVSALNDVFGHQMSVTPDGKIWSTVSSVQKGSTDPAQVTLGSFPTIGNIGSNQFAWATRQKPTISPQGDRVALMGTEELNGTVRTYIFDGNTITKYGEGIPQGWYDNNQVIVRRGDTLLLLDAKSGTERVLE